MIEQKAEFGGLYKGYQPKVYQYFLNRIKNPHLSEDLTSETFLKGFMAYERYKPTNASIKFWFFTIAHNLLIDYYRKEHPVSLDTVLPPYIDKPHPISVGETIVDSNKENDPILMTEVHAQATKLRESLEKLSLNQQLMIKMHYLDEMNYEEIAQVTGKSKGAIRVIVFRALSKLREVLKDEDMLVEEAS